MILRRRKSITFRLTLLFATASTVVLLLLGTLIAGSVERHFEEQDLEILNGKLKLTRHAVEKIKSPADLDALPQQLDDSLVGHRGLAVVVVAPNGEIIYATSGADFPHALLDAGAREQGAPPMVWKTKDHQALRGIAALAYTGVAGEAPATVAVATDISMHEHFMRSFSLTLWSFVVLAACITGFLGWVAARRGLAPLQAIKQKAARITAHQLHARLPLESVPVELADLVETLNEMLTRLESSFKQLSEFSSDIAHELRTPLSNLLTQTQVTLAKTRTGDVYRDVLASNVEELERLSRTISDMLFLAKAENQLLVPCREKIDLADEVSGLFAFYEALADEKSLVLSSSGRGLVSGDRLMLRRAISNLLSNAIRHTPQGGRIDVLVSDANPPWVTLAVENSGETIAPEHLPRLFDRFYRVDLSRQHSTEGAGLGLAITRSIARAHGGDASVRSSCWVTVFELTIPAPSLARNEHRR